MNNSKYSNLYSNHQLCKSNRTSQNKTFITVIICIYCFAQSCQGWPQSCAWMPVALLTVHIFHLLARELPPCVSMDARLYRKLSFNQSWRRQLYLINLSINSYSSKFCTVQGWACWGKTLCSTMEPYCHQMLSKPVPSNRTADRIFVVPGFEDLLDNNVKPW